MTIDKKKNLKLFIILVSVLFIYISVKKYKEIQDQSKASQPITINLLTSVHPDLSWSFTAVKKKITIKPGDVTTIKYIVENLGSETTSGIATFAYSPQTFGNYINKLNCFCYDAKTLKPNQKSEYSVILLIDPEVTKDSKTKNVKEVSMQFTFFDYKKYKEN